MAHPSVSPSSLEMSGRIDEALAESGLAQPVIEREPLPLFDILLDEWIVCQGVDETDVWDSGWRELLPVLLHTVPACAIQEAVHVMAAETCQLSRAHGSLNAWNQRELDTRVKTMLVELDQAELIQNKVPQS